MSDRTDNRILNYDQYAEIEKEGFPIPYLVTAKNQKQDLLFYGSKHTTNPNHPQFKDIENKWKKFIKPEELIHVMNKNQLELLDITGMSYDMINKNWYLSDNLDVNYIVCFRKIK